MSESNVKIPVDLTNPGQFFACCGFLELASPFWPDADGWFEYCQLVGHGFRVRIVDKSKKLSGA
jgi:CRISPR-associated protein Csb3